MVVYTCKTYDDGIQGRVCVREGERGRFEMMTKTIVKKVDKDEKTKC